MAKTGHRPEYNPFPPRISETLSRRGTEVGLPYVDSGIVARATLRNWENGYNQGLTGEQIQFIIAVDQADPEKREPNPKLLDRQRGQRIRKARTGNRRG
jgi:hypothetical protein